MNTERADMDQSNGDELKRCPHCNVWKIRSTEFSRARDRYDGAQAYCRECVRATRPVKPPPPASTEALVTKRCTQCGRTVNDGIHFTRDAWQKDGLRKRCHECVGAARKRANAFRNQEKNLKREKEKEQKRADALAGVVLPGKKCHKCYRGVADGAEFGKDKHHGDGFNTYCKACRRRAGSARYWANLDAMRAYNRKKYWRDVNRSRAKSQAFKNRHRERLLALIRRRYWADPEAARARLRAEYWKDVEHTRRRNRARRLQGCWSVTSLDDARPGRERKMGQSRMERIANPSAPNPADIVVSEPARLAALGWLATLTNEEQDLLTTFAENGFDLAITSELLGMPADIASERLSAVQARARAEIPGED